MIFVGEKESKELPRKPSSGAGRCIVSLAAASLCLVFLASYSPGLLFRSWSSSPSEISSVCPNRFPEEVALPSSLLTPTAQWRVAFPGPCWCRGPHRSGSWLGQGRGPELLAFGPVVRTEAPRGSREGAPAGQPLPVRECLSSCCHLHGTSSLQTDPGVMCSGPVWKSGGPVEVSLAAPPPLGAWEIIPCFINLHLEFE